MCVITWVKCLHWPSPELIIRTIARQGPDSYIKNEKYTQNTELMFSETATNPLPFYTCFKLDKCALTLHKDL